MKCLWNRGWRFRQAVIAGGLVGAVVVADQVDVQMGGDLVVDLGEEFLELDRPVPGQLSGTRRERNSGQPSYAASAQRGPLPVAHPAGDSANEKTA